MMRRRAGLGASLCGLGLFVLVFSAMAAAQAESSPKTGEAGSTRPAGEIEARRVPRGPSKADDGASSPPIDSIIAEGSKLKLEVLKSALWKSRDLAARAKLSDVERALSLIERDTQPVRSFMQVQNHTPFRIYCFIEGTLVGWVGENAIYTIRGLTPGYYTLFGRTYYGAASWGPTTVYLPSIHHFW